MEEIFILIAEDDADDRFLLQSAFEENGYKDTLHFVENGVEIIEYLNGVSQGQGQVKVPRFILLDLNMPKKDGREVLREIKQNHFLKKIPVIIFSSTNTEQEMRRCYELGANAYLVKPLDLDTYCTVVRAAITFWSTCEFRRLATG